MRRELKRGDIWYANLGEAKRGGPQGEPRPCVICQAEEGLDSHLILIAPVSSSPKPPYPFLQEINIKYRSQIHYNHLTTIKRSDLQRYIGRLNKKQLREMDIRLAVPTGLSITNYLHIEGINIDRVEKSPSGENLYKGKISLLYGKRPFSFTSSDLATYLGEHRAKDLESEGDNLSSFLETLQGMHFLYDFVNREVRI